MNRIAIFLLFLIAAQPVSARLDVAATLSGGYVGDETRLDYWSSSVRYDEQGYACPCAWGISGRDVVTTSTAFLYFDEWEDIDGEWTTSVALYGEPGETYSGTVQASVYTDSSATTTETAEHQTEYITLPDPASSPDPDPTLEACHNCGSSNPEPLVLDLDGDGIMTSGIDRPVLFDLDGDGTSESISWIEAGDDAFLWLDLQSNGRVDGGQELFGIGTVLPDGTKAPHGFAALAAWDELDQVEMVMGQSIHATPSGADLGCGTTRITTGFPRTAKSHRSTPLE